MADTSVKLTHLACIMDGNRRYAQKNNFPSFWGHKAGLDTVKRAVEFCLKEHIAYLSLYAFSLENFNRSASEVSYLLDLIVQGIDQYKAEIIQSGVRVRFIGDRSLFPAHVLPAIKAIENETIAANKLQLQILFCYGGRQELVSAVQRIVEDVQSGVIEATAISADLLKKYTWMSTIPDPELIIRTGGHQRLSNFLLYHSAYSDLYFIDEYWPALQEEHFYKALQYYNSIKRNFGS
jgi:undecaprenyl diphosphate synthase